LLNNDFWRSKFVRHSLTLIAGSTIAQAIPVLVSPLLTRIYTPSDFGILAIFLTITSVLTILVTGRYELSVVLPEDPVDSANLSVFTILLSFISSLLVLAFIFLFKGFIFSFIESEVLKKWLFVVPLIVFFQGLAQTFEFLLNKQKSYKDISLVKVTRAVTSSGSRLGLGYYGLGTSGLLYGNLLSSLLGGLLIFYFAARKNYNVLRKVNIPKMKSLAVRYNKFPRFSLGTGLINSLSINVPVIMLTSFFTSGVVGFYALANRILKQIMNLIGRNVSRVFYEQSSELVKDTEKLSRLSYKLYFRMLIIGISSLGIIMFFGDHLFAVIFGDRWITAGNYARILSFGILFNFVAAPLTYLLSVLEKQEKSLFWEILLFMLRVIPFAVGIIVGMSIYKMLAFFSILSGLYYFSFSLYTLSLIHVSFVKIILGTIVILGGIGGFYGVLRMLIF